MNRPPLPAPPLDAGRETEPVAAASATTEVPRRTNGRHPHPSRPSPSRPLGRVFRLERSMLRTLLQRIGAPPVAFVLWNGEEVAACDGAPRFRVHVHDRTTLWRIVLDPMFQFGEAYTDGRAEVEGGLVPFLRIVCDRMRPLPGPARHVRSLPRWHGEEGVNLAGSRSNVYHHYDIGNDFYRLWLDEQLLYTCAYYARPEFTLEQAQIAKMDHVCRKLGLRPGETVVEAGCGWGALALHMARAYGVSVRAYNVSREQIAWARDRARREGLDGRVEFIEEDWRNISGRCDAFVSVGMLEHVGVDNYRELGDVIHRALAPHGRGLIHTIGRNYPGQLSAWIRHRIFPGAQPPALSQMVDLFEHHDCSVLDVENIRLHYAVTLKHWLERFETRTDEVREQFDERFVRMWRLYLASSMVAFEIGALQLFQVLFAPGGNTRVPWTRDAVYRDDDAKQPGEIWDRLKLRAD